MNSIDSTSGAMAKPRRTRIVRIETSGGPRWGGVLGTTVRALEGDPFWSWQFGEELGELDGLTLLPPTVPTKIVCVGLNYAAHAEESDSAVPTEPLLFFKPPSAVIGPAATIVLPGQSGRVDYEAEMAIVRAARCRDVTVEEAWSFAAGITCGNDVTARDLQARDDQWTRAKGFDTFCPLGPWLLTGAAESDLADLGIECRVNGEVRQRGRTSDMIFSPAELIAYVSSIMTLQPGDVIMTGTPEGVGPLSSGDVVEVDVDGVGTLWNPVEDDDT